MGMGGTACALTSLQRIRRFLDEGKGDGFADAGEELDCGAVEQLGRHLQAWFALRVVVWVDVRGGSPLCGRQKVACCAVRYGGNVAAPLEFPRFDLLADCFE